MKNLFLTNYTKQTWLIDDSIMEVRQDTREPEPQEDNVRVYIPLDINRKAVLRRLLRTITRYGEANEKNESNFQMVALKHFLSK